MGVLHFRNHSIRMLGFLMGEEKNFGRRPNVAFRTGKVSIRMVAHEMLEQAIQIVGMGREGGYRRLGAMGTAGIATDRGDADTGSSGQMHFPPMFFTEFRIGERPITEQAQHLGCDTLVLRRVAIGGGCCGRRQWNGDQFFLGRQCQAKLPR